MKWRQACRKNPFGRCHSHLHSCKGAKKNEEKPYETFKAFLLFVSRLLFFVLCFWFYYIYPFLLVLFVLFCFVAAAFTRFQCLNAFSGRNNKTERTWQIRLICITHPMEGHANELCKLLKLFCESHFKEQKPARTRVHVEYSRNCWLIAAFMLLCCILLCSVNKTIYEMPHIYCQYSGTLLWLINGSALSCPRFCFMRRAMQNFGQAPHKS